MYIYFISYVYVCMCVWWLPCLPPVNHIYVGPYNIAFDCSYFFLLLLFSSVVVIRMSNVYFKLIWLQSTPEVRKYKYSNSMKQ